MFRSILVGFDGSSHAKRALDEAVALAQSHHAALTVMTVVPDPRTLAGIGTLGYGAPDLARARSELAKDYARTLDAAIDAIPADLPVTKRIVHGKPGPRTGQGRPRGQPRPRRRRVTRARHGGVLRDGLSQHLRPSPPARRGVGGARRARGGVANRPPARTRPPSSPPFARAGGTRRDRHAPQRELPRER
jgi:hypothetical protein